MYTVYCKSWHTQLQTLSPYISGSNSETVSDFENHLSCSDLNGRSQSAASTDRFHCPFEEKLQSVDLCLNASKAETRTLGSCLKYPCPSVKSIQQMQIFWTFSTLCCSIKWWTVNRSLKAHLDSRRNPFSRVEAQICLTTHVPAKLKYLAHHRNTPQKLARWRNSFSRVETPNRLMNYVPAEAS